MLNDRIIEAHLKSASITLEIAVIWMTPWFDCKTQTLLPNDHNREFLLIAQRMNEECFLLVK